MVIKEKSYGEPTTFRDLVQSQSIKKQYTKSIVTGPHAHNKMLTVTFLVSIYLAHSDITIDISTQNSLLQDVKMCTNPSYKYTHIIKIFEY